MKCLILHSVDIPQDHRWDWTYMWKTNTEQKSLFFLGAKIWSKTSPSIKNVRTSSSFTQGI